MIIQSNLQNVKKPAFSCPNGTVISGNQTLTKSGTYCVNGSATVTTNSTVNLTFTGCNGMTGSGTVTLTGNHFGTVTSDIFTIINGPSTVINKLTVRYGAEFNTPTNSRNGITIGGGSGTFTFNAVSGDGTTETAVNCVTGGSLRIVFKKQPFLSGFNFVTQGTCVGKSCTKVNGNSGTITNSNDCQ